MKEQDLQTECIQVDHLELDGKMVLRGLMIKRGGKLYKITVATPNYLSELNSYNQKFPPDVQIDNNIYPLNDLSSREEICKNLSAIPLETLQPFLTEQIQIPEENSVQ